jgi:hypothetical protein
LFTRVNWTDVTCPTYKESCRLTSYSKIDDSGSAARVGLHESTYARISGGRSRWCWFACGEGCVWLGTVKENILVSFIFSRYLVYKKKISTSWSLYIVHKVFILNGTLPFHQNNQIRSLFRTWGLFSLSSPTDMTLQPNKERNYYALFYSSTKQKKMEWLYFVCQTHNRTVPLLKTGM